MHDSHQVSTCGLNARRHVVGTLHAWLEVAWNIQKHEIYNHEVHQTGVFKKKVSHFEPNFNVTCNVLHFWGTGPVVAAPKPK
jgi:hypothetical protein